MNSTFFTAGCARRSIVPPGDVELAGLGYYLGRRWRSVRDSLAATAAVLTDHDGNSIGFAALDLMYNDASFTGRVRTLVSEVTDLRPENLCVNFSHTHGAPTAGFIRGAGERDPDYLAFAAARTAEAVIAAWKSRVPARLLVGESKVQRMTFNRAQAGGPVDETTSVLRVETAQGRPLLICFNFHAHCTAFLEQDLFAISRDWPGEAVDILESTLPGVQALYLQGTCGDVNFKRELNGTERCHEPSRAVADAALRAWAQGRPVAGRGVASVSLPMLVPTRRWTSAEIRDDREEGLYRLATGDTRGWQEGLAKVCVNQPERLPLRYGGSVEAAVRAISRFAVEWTDAALAGAGQNASGVPAEVQALRAGDVLFAAHPGELFTSFGLALRACVAEGPLFILGYSNGSIGYVPDAAEIARRGYAALQSPKFTGQQPFTPESGAAMVQAMARLCGRLGLASSAG